jgi:hypothetical protein
MKIHSHQGKSFPVRSIACAVLVSLGLHAQAQQNSIDQRVEGILSQMTLEQKISYISGLGFDPTFSNGRVGVFNIKGDEHLGTELGLPEIYGVDACRLPLLQISSAKSTASSRW